MNIRYFEKRGTWWLDFKDASGTRKRVPSHQITQALAEKAAPAILALALAASPISETEVPRGKSRSCGLTFRQAFDQGMKEREKWITSKDRKGLRSNFAALVPYWGEEADCSKADRAAVLVYRTKLLALPGKATGSTTSHATVNHKLSMLSVLLEIAKCPPHTVKHLSTRGNERIRRLRDSELAAVRQWLLAHAERPGCLSMHALVMVALHTAARQGELLALTWPDVYFDNEAVVFRDTKDGAAGRTVPLSHAALAILRDRYNGAAKTLAGPFSDLSSFRVVDLWADARKALGLAADDEFVFHLLRHESLSRIADSGENAFVIKDYAGHSDISTTQRYVKSGTQALKRAASVFNLPTIDLAGNLK